MLPFHCKETRDILQEKLTLITVPFTNFYMFFNNYALKKNGLAKITIRKGNADKLSSLIPTYVYIYFKIH